MHNHRGFQDEIIPHSKMPTRNKSMSSENILGNLLFLLRVVFRVDWLPLVINNRTRSAKADKYKKTKTRGDLEWTKKMLK